MLVDVPVVANLQGGGIDKTNAAANAEAVFEVDTQRYQGIWHPFDETLVGGQSRKLDTPVATDLLLVKVLEVAVGLTMKAHQNRHDFAQTH